MFMKTWLFYFWHFWHFQYVQLSIISPWPFFFCLMENMSRVKVVSWTVTSHRNRSIPPTTTTPPPPLVSVLRKLYSESDILSLLLWEKRTEQKYCVCVFVCVHQEPKKNQKKTAKRLLDYGFIWLYFSRR